MPAWLHLWSSLRKHRLRGYGKLLSIFFVKACLDLGVATQGSQPRARNIDEDEVEGFIGYGKRLGRIVSHDRNDVAPRLRHALFEHAQLLC